MVTRDERRALLFLAAVAAAGGVMRAVRPGGIAPAAPAPVVVTGPAATAPATPAALAAQLERLARAESLARPLVPGERVDVDRAGAEELERLPGVGPALAARIVADRDSGGPFGSLAALDRVSGVGPAMLRRLAPWVTFGRPARGAEVQVLERVAPARRAP